MGSLATPHVSIALSRLRRGVNACCWIVVLSLITQLMIWGVATFMDVRHQVIEEHATPATVVSAAAVARQQPLGSAEAVPLEAPQRAHAETQPPANPNRLVTKHDQIMRHAAVLSMTAGSIAMLLMLPMLMVGVMLGAGSATPGVESVVSSFLWSLIIGLLVLPVGHHIGLPWSEGGFASYDNMTQHVDREMADGHWGSIPFYVRFGMLPLACLVGAGIIGLRFSNGVRSGILPKEDMRLDPVLEREAANVKAGSLVGGRAVAALRSVPSAAAAVVAAAAPAPTVTAVSVGGASEVKPGMLQVTAGEAPRRLI